MRRSFAFLVLIAEMAVAQPLRITTFAGDVAHTGVLDGAGTTARFGAAEGIHCDRAGNIYVADPAAVVIRRITPAGIVTTIAGIPFQGGYRDGAASQALFLDPQDLAVDSSGNVYITDANVVRRLSPDGVVSTVAGTFGGPSTTMRDGDRSTAVLSNPFGITIDASGNLFITDATTVRRITPDGFVTTVAGNPTQSVVLDGAGSAAGFASPRYITTDVSGNFYITDGSVIRKMTPQFAVSTFAGVPGDSGVPRDGVFRSSARFNGPRGIAVDLAGNLYVADAGNDVVQRISPAGLVSVAAGAVASVGHVDGIGTAARFSSLRGVAVDNLGHVFIGDVFTTDDIYPESRGLIRQGEQVARPRAARH
jgi:hypothetical protein